MEPGRDEAPLERLARDDDRIAKAAREAREEGELALQGERETGDGVRLPPDVARADRVRARDDVKLAEEQEEAAHGQREAAEALRRSGERLERGHVELDRTDAAVRDIRGEAEEIREDTRALGEQVREARRAVGNTDVPRVD